MDNKTTDQRIMTAFGVLMKDAFPSPIEEYIKKINKEKKDEYSRNTKKI